MTKASQIGFAPLYTGGKNRSVLVWNEVFDHMKKWRKLQR